VVEDNILKVSLVQFAPCWEDVDGSLSRLNSLMLPLEGKTDLILLPEMFPTGFSMNTDKICNEKDTAKVLQWLQKRARSTSAMIVGGVAVKESGNYHNRLYWVCPNGVIDHYDKHHLFSMSDEPLHYMAGTSPKRFFWRRWEIKPIICYELRFPEWCRNTRNNPYDLLICAASWPNVRSDAWLTLLKARALENQCYVVGINRVGKDGNGLQHTGDSIVYSPKGEIILQIPEYEEKAATVKISQSTMIEFRKKFRPLGDMD
jgi:predicted amidohydrolase